MFHLMCRRPLAVLLLSLLLAPAAPALANEALARSKNCMACHGVDKRLVGPSMTEVARRYQDRADASAYLTGRIVKGSAGVWGPVPMPAQGAQVTAAEAALLAEWIRGLR